MVSWFKTGFGLELIQKPVSETSFLVPYLIWTGQELIFHPIISTTVKMVHFAEIWRPVEIGWENCTENLQGCISVKKRTISLKLVVVPLFTKVYTHFYYIKILGFRLKHKNLRNRQSCGKSASSFFRQKSNTPGAYGNWLSLQHGFLVDPAKSRHSPDMNFKKSGAKQNGRVTSGVNECLQEIFVKFDKLN